MSLILLSTWSIPDHVGLPNVLDLAVHLVQLMTWKGWGGHTLSNSSLEHSFMVKSYFENVLWHSFPLCYCSQSKLKGLLPFIKSENSIILVN